MSKKRKRRKGSLKALKQMVSPTKEFEFANPNDADDILYFTARRLSPGHLLELDNTTLIRAYREHQSQAEAENPEDSDISQEEAELVAFKKIITEVKYSAEIASMSLIDEETEETLLTAEECMEYLLPDWNTQIATWALGGARPAREGEGADDVDRFPEESGRQDASDVETETAGDGDLL